MALARWVLTADVTLPAGAFTENLYAAAGTPVNGTGSNAQGAGLWGSNGGSFFRKGMIIWADSAGGNGGASALYTAIGAANLRAFVDGQDTVGRHGTAN